MEPYITLTIIVSLTLLLLAFMAMFIEVGVEWLEGSKFPKINITFKKDRSLFNFLRPSNGKVEAQKKIKEDGENTSVVKIMEDSDYIEKCLIGSATIKYGEKAETLSRSKFIIEALKDDVDKYYYYHPDSGTKIKLVSGFNDSPTGYKKLRDFPSCDGTCDTGPFPGINKVTLPIPKMRKGETRSLEYSLCLNCHYKEIQPGYDLVSHNFYFRIRSNLYGASLSFHLPNGKESNIVKIELIVMNGEKIVYSRDINVIGNLQFTLDNDYGNGWIDIEKRNTSIYWNISSLLKKGYAYKIKWFIQRMG